MNKLSKQIENILGDSFWGIALMDGTHGHTDKEIDEMIKQILSTIKEYVAKEIVGGYEQDIIVVNQKTGEVEPDFAAHERNKEKEKQLNKLDKDFE